MIRSILYIFIAALLALPHLSSAAEITFDDKVCGTSQNLTIGDLLEVRLPGNPTTGYSWQAVTVPAQLRQQGEPVHHSDSQLIGAGGISSFKFSVAEAGGGSLDLAYRRPWEKEAQPARSCRIQLQITASSADTANRPLILSTAQQQVAAAFERLDSGLRKAAGELGKTGPTGDDARRVLAAACQEFSYAVDCSTVDTNGRLTTIEPARYRSFEGKDISDQEQVKRMLKLRKPVLSQVFHSVEGYDAVDAEYPVFRPAGDFIGSVSIMFKPERFLGEIIQPLVKGARFDISVMDLEGRTLYDSDPAQVGLNIFTSSQFQPYTEFVQLARKIAATPQGNGTYRFKKENLTGPDADKKAYWTSVSLYGVSWRLVGISLAGDN